MTRLLIVLFTISILASCRSTRKIGTAIAKKDSSTVAAKTSVKKENDTLQLIQSTLNKVEAQRINFRTFAGKLNVDYRSGDGKSYNVNANLRMYKDSAIWISANALLGIEAMRVLITKDSVKVLDKLNKTYMGRSLSYLQEVTALPMTLAMLQDLIIGNPVFLDSNIVSFKTANNTISLLSIGEVFKNLLTLDASDTTLQHSKLDDVNLSRNRTADLTYSDYEDKKGQQFATKRTIVVAEKNRLDIRLDFKQYDFNGDVSFPFSIPKNYDRN
jgi:RNase H-fold protein (predicted Holliday junction resolvase)